MWEESMYVCEYEEFLPVMCSFYNVCVWINIYVCVCVSLWMLCMSQWVSWVFTQAAVWLAFLH